MMMVGHPFSLPTRTEPAVSTTAMVTYVSVVERQLTAIRGVPWHVPGALLVRCQR